MKNIKKRYGKESKAVLFFCMLEYNGSHSAFEEQELKMFEKEAREYRTHFENELYLFDNIDIFPKDIEEAYQKGAEFGYNKANEWNFTHRDEQRLVVDCPKGEENKLYLLLLNSRDSKEFEFGRKVPVVCYWNEEWCRFERLEHTIGERNINKNDINAWKEIVLPKEIKENGKN